MFILEAILISVAPPSLWMQRKRDLIKESRKMHLVVGSDASPLFDDTRESREGKSFRLMVTFEFLGVPT